MDSDGVIGWEPGIVGPEPISPEDEVARVTGQSVDGRVLAKALLANEQQGRDFLRGRGRRITVIINENKLTVTVAEKAGAGAAVGVAEHMAEDAAGPVRWIFTHGWYRSGLVSDHPLYRIPIPGSGSNGIRVSGGCIESPFLAVKLNFFPNREMGFSIQYHENIHTRVTSGRQMCKCNKREVTLGIPGT
jgi:hypothetical protein